MKTRAIFAVAVAVMAALTSAPAASAASTGTTPVGSTITATAWERGGLDDFRYGGLSVDIRPAGGFEEYVYRIHSGGASVDVQGTSGYEGLTDAEQTQWYVDAGYAPYQFTWIAFTCLATLDAQSDNVLVDAGISLTEMHYVAADELFPLANRDYSKDYIDRFQAPYSTDSLFDIDNYSREVASITGYVSEVVHGNGVTSPFIEMLFSVSYPEFSCPVGSNLEVFQIKDSANPSSFAIGRNLVIPDQLSIAINGNTRLLAAEGVFVGVTGGAVDYNFNAALWGMTQVDGKLASTGTDASVLGLLGVGLAVVGLAAFVLRRARRRSV